MNARFPILSLAAIGVAKLALGQPPGYNVGLLPSPPGSTADTAEVAAPGAVGGQSFAGEWDEADGIWQPTLWQGSQPTLLPVPQGEGGGITGISASGVVVGYLTPGPIPAAWSGGQLQILDTAGFSGGYATSVNRSGLIAGRLNGSDGSQVPVTWSGGGTTNLGLPQGATSAGAAAVNDAGQVLVVGGTATSSSSWIWSQGVYTKIPDIGVSATTGHAMNNLGQVVGSADLFGSSHATAFLYTGGITAPLATPTEDVFTIPTAINDSGVIVGYGSDGITGEHALLWENGQVLDLNTLIPANSGWTLSEALGIGQDGTIVGTGEFDGSPRAFELAPSASPSAAVPEPASLGILALGAAALLRRRRR